MTEIRQGSTNFKQVLYPTAESKWRDEYCKKHYEPLSNEQYGRMILHRVRLHLQNLKDYEAITLLPAA